MGKSQELPLTDSVPLQTAGTAGRHNCTMCRQGLGHPARIQQQRLTWNCPSPDVM
jgi:hypothetical protein